MDLKFKYVCIVDYDKPNIENRDVTDDMNGYILDLYNIIEDSDKLQFFTVKDKTMQVINNVINIIKDLHNGDTEGISSMMDSISNRLREKESDAQKKVEKMGIDVKKGSLLQAVFKEPLVNEYEYLISKTEHNRFMEEEKFNIREGFNIDKKNLWKSCMLRCAINDDGEVDIIEIKIYLDNSAKYWTEDFLEIEELRDNQQNTQQFFRNVERVLKRNVYNHSKEDYHVLRSSIIEYIRSSNQIDYPEIINDKFKKYKYTGLNNDQKTKLITKLNELQEKKFFDTQFEPDSSALSVRIIKETYKLTNDIDLIVKDINSENKIEAYEDDFGKKYVKIETDNEDIYNRYKKI